MSKLRAACIQLNAGPAIDPNLKIAGDFARKARADGAELIAFPENVCLMVPDRARRFALAKPEDAHPAVAFFSQLAKDTGAWIVAGSIAVNSIPDKLANRSLLFDPQGNIAARYDKIHLFDVDLAGGESYRESESFQSGAKLVTADLPWGMLGMTVCYDLRFPHLYRDLAKKGAQIITIPSAFTVPTGRAHWHVLLRARAIETGAFILAPAQCGTHEGDRKTFGHSLIIDPWGEILAEADDAPGIIMADLNLDDVTRVRGMVPSLKHDKPYA